MSMDAIVALIQRGNDFLVFPHRRPDADAFGSALALAAGIRALGKQAAVYLPEAVPSSLAFLPGSDAVIHQISSASSFDASFVLDTAALSLFPSGLPSKEAMGSLVVLDHHRVHDDFGDLVFRDVEASSTGELVAALLERLGLQQWTLATATPLYAALVGDTGGFRYPGTSVRTFQLAARLLSTGIDPWEVAYHLFEGWPFERLQLLREVLASLRLELGGKLATMVVDLDMLRRTGATEEMVDGLVNYGRSIAGVEVAALLWERPPGAEGQALTQLSLRSRGLVDVSNLAMKFGGGGHHGAAAAQVQSSVEALRERLLSVVEEALRGVSRG